MSSITFDRLSYLETLKASGVPEAQACAHAVAMDQALRESVATKADVHVAVFDLKAEILKWMFGGFVTVIGMLVAILMKLH